MARLIDADALMSRLQEYFSGVLDSAGDDFCDGKAEAAHEFGHMIATAQTVERKSVKWIAVDPDTRGYTDAFRCSECNAMVQLGGYRKSCYFDYCPWCGAGSSDESC